MIQDVIIEKESLEYYQYLDQKYREIVSFLGKTDGAVDMVKVQLYFERVTVPFSSWKDAGNDPVAKKEQSKENIPEEKEKHLTALCRKYGLEKKGKRYVIKNLLTKEKFNELREKMKEEGFRYEPKEGFVEAQ